MKDRGRPQLGCQRERSVGRIESKLPEPESTHDFFRGVKKQGGRKAAGRTNMAPRFVRESHNGSAFHVNIRDAASRDPASHVAAIRDAASHASQLSRFGNL